MSDTAQHLESEIEAHRAGVEQTLDKLKQRLSVDQMIDDVGQFIGVDNVRGTLNAAGQQVRENPMALALIGAGVAWLMMGRGSSGRSSDDAWHGESDSGYGGKSGDRWQSYASGQDNLHDTETYTDKAKAKVAELGDTLSHIPEKARSVMDQAVEGVHSTVESVKERAESTVRPLTDTLAAQPLLVGGAAVVIGAILGSALPRTRTENRLLGPQRDKLMQAATRATSDMGERLSEAAKATYDAATTAARDEGLLPDAGSDTLAQKVERVATAAVDTAASQVEPVLHGAEDGMKSESETGFGDKKGKRQRN